MAIVASDWNNRIRGAAMKIASQIPEVGAVASSLIGFLWPENKIDIFEALKVDLTKLVKKEILDYELNLHHSEIGALKIIIQRYKEARSHEKGYFLNNWITEADKLSVICQESTNNIHLILPTITVALLHLTGLLERLNFGKDLYDEDNTKQWKQDLEETYKTYIVDFLPDIFKKWKLWRADQVEIKGWTETHPILLPPFFLISSLATVLDTLTGESKHYTLDVQSSTTIFSSVCEDHKTRMCNDATADMASCISTTFVFRELLRDNKKNFPRYDKEVFGRMFRGPYSENLLQTGGNFGIGSKMPNFIRPDHDDYSSNSGPITKVIIREWNSIDAMQFIYMNRQGSLCGNAQGGQRHEIDVTGKAMSGLRMGFSNSVLVFVQIIYYDGTSSSTYGNRSGWNCAEVSPKAPSGYMVSSWSCKAYYGPSKSYCPSVVQLEYAPQME